MVSLRSLYRLKVALLLADLGLSFAIHQPFSQETELPDTFNWTSIKPSAKLEYHRCYDGLECARLSVPLSWVDRSNPNFVTLAIARLPARMKKMENSFGGTIILNPGGPSGSGVDLLRWAGRGIQEIVDGEKAFEILSFDPRGTKYSTPSSSCFESDQARYLLQLQSAAVGSVDSSRVALNTKWAEAAGLGKLCSATELGKYPDGSSIRQYVSTALVARDMIQIIDCVQNHQDDFGSGLSSTPAEQVLSSTSSARKSPPLLNYWGYSYGTYLGNTFASMFPSRVGRMVLDGVVDAPDYTASGWTSNLQDNNHVWEKFYEWCFDAGPRCALYNPAFSGPDHMQSAVDHFIEDNLKDDAMSFVINGNVYLFTYLDFIAQMHFASYGPYQTWPQLAVGLAALLQGDAKALVSLEIHLPSPQSFDRLDRSSRIPVLDTYHILDPYNNRSSPYPPGYPHAFEAIVSIACGDGDEINMSTKDEYDEYIHKLVNQSSLIGPVWAEITLKCRHWPRSQRPSYLNRFTGPFGSNLSSYDPRASPLLFIGNTADPVTPVRNAFEMAKHHEGAGVLVLDSPGHCSGTNIPSKCSWNAVKSFFNNGTLPKNGTVCPVDWKPWDKLNA